MAGAGGFGVFVVVRSHPLSCAGAQRWDVGDWGNATWHPPGTHLAATLPGWLCSPNPALPRHSGTLTLLLHLGGAGGQSPPELAQGVLQGEKAGTQPRAGRQCENKAGAEVAVTLCYACVFPVCGDTLGTCVCSACPRVPSPGSVPGQFGWGSEQAGLVEG